MNVVVVPVRHGVEDRDGPSPCAGGVVQGGFVQWEAFAIVDERPHHVGAAFVIDDGTDVGLTQQEDLSCSYHGDGHRIAVNLNLKMHLGTLPRPEGPQSGVDIPYNHMRYTSG